MSLELATLATGLGKAVLPGIAKQVVTKLNSQFNPTDLEKALQFGINSAENGDKKQPVTQQLFYHCDDKQSADILQQFLKDTGVQEELQKPLKDQTTPNLEFLIAKFKDITSQNSQLKFPPQSIENWLKRFTDAYFEHTNTYLKFRLAKADYLKQLVKYFDDVEFVGLKVATREEEKFAKLPEIFVMPNVVEQADYREFNFRQFLGLKSLKDNQLIDKIQDKLSQDEQRSERKFSAQQLLKESSSGKFVLLGEPGVGKTTLMSYFAVILAENQAEQLGLPADIDLLPILIRIRDLARAVNPNILEYIRDFAKNIYLKAELPKGFFEHWLEDGRALILLDGLDEIADASKRYEFVKNIETFLGQYSQNRAIITSRPAGYSRNYFRTDNFPHYRLEKFDDSQIDLFIQKWYDSRLPKNPEESRQCQESLKKALGEQARIKLLARNPLLLTIIALIHRYQAYLPRQRYKLYEQAVDTLLINWDEVKQIGKCKLDYINASDIKELLQRLAYWIHTQPRNGDQEGGTLIDKDELITQLSKYIIEFNYQVQKHQAKAEAERFVDHIRERSGLLNEQGQDIYAFVHKTFQEYLTAEEIRVRQEESFDEVLEHIEKHLHDSHWREVLLLLIAQQKRSNPKKVIEAILQRHTPYEQWLHRNLLFAGNCLGEDLQLSDSDLITDILQRLVNLEAGDFRRVGSKIKAQVFKILCSLNETKFQSQALQILKASADLIGEHRLREYRAALGEKEQVLAELLALLQNPIEGVRFSTTEALGKLGNTVPEVVSQLLALLQDKSELVRYSVASALGNLGNTTPEVVSQLLALLQDKSELVRYSVASALGNLGNTTPEVVSQLLALLQDKSKLVRYSAASALGKLGNAAPEVVSQLLALLQDESDNEDVRSATAFALSKLGNAAPEVVSQLLALLQDESQRVRCDAASALGNLGNAAPEIVSQLLVLLQDESERVRCDAASALGKLGNAAPEIVSQLLVLLQDESERVRCDAASALGKLGNAAPEVVSQLLALLQDKSGLVCSRAAEALGNLGKKSSDITATIAQWISQHQDSEYLGNGIDVLWELVVAES
ncbi:NACHT domain-containing NTPase [Nostoc sp. TCL26-01]|uniref:NACHT domain-containing protein n=1 Tax=Nostoc sp. TCL26-01 TaxID=2576904 RepID=UPI0015BCED3B|nr:HEAT repeat domain-containing protein [Nostoc sp. TCL26-01]QLE58290.1 NACHT domain-containing protein [Nostoc sp. TCL26-01]